MPGEAEGQFQREVPEDGTAESQGQPGGEEQEEEDVTGADIRPWISRVTPRGDTKMQTVLHRARDLHKLV